MGIGAYISIKINLALDISLKAKKTFLKGGMKTVQLIRKNGGGGGNRVVPILVYVRSTWLIMLLQH